METTMNIGKILIGIAVAMIVTGCTASRQSGLTNPTKFVMELGQDGDITLRDSDGNALKGISEEEFYRDSKSKGYLPNGITRLDTITVIKSNPWWVKIGEKLYCFGSGCK